jgi:hypothetical protein
MFAVIYGDVDVCSAIRNLSFDVIDQGRYSNIKDNSVMCAIDDIEKTLLKICVNRQSINNQHVDNESDNVKFNEVKTKLSHTIQSYKKFFDDV